MDERASLVVYRQILCCVKVCLWAFFALGVSANVSAKEKLRVAVAANFAAPLKAIAEEFTHSTDVDVVITVSSSGTLFAQIMHGAAFDVFLSADTARVKALIEAGRVSTSDVEPYAVGQLAFVSRSAPITVKELLSRNNDVLSLNSYKLAIANPKLAPYGEAAKEVLEGHARWNNMRQHIVMGKNVLQTYQFYRTGNVDSAFVAYSLVKDEPNVDIVSPRLYSPIVQSLAILIAPATAQDTHFSQDTHFAEDTHKKLDSQARQRQLAEYFVNYLLSKKVQQKIEGWGYKPVSSLSASKE
ncbi:molybdate ABC transporter substrate-binding protein [Alteromonas sp. 345S023]|uniref:Molybdate ABC transporter substrate-binding protein n=1 Tax=Alteromonas profundi TaxID=2696062 RepID=A0A7X5LL08_9ALTE|nr:molybdate ABC transporter substrate-binding protein [Alteromonas profundi]NDV90670.1 molybdate ABC transporter substrate-binding protein [Alteromonas profundi]